MIGAAYGPRISYTEPARTWLEALPIGNGRTGAMVHGGAGRSRIQVNDSTAWSGTPDGPAEALAALVADGAGPGLLAAARTAMAAGDLAAAQTWLARFQGPYTQAFQPFVDLWTQVDASAGDGSGVLGYSRWLDLRDGVAGESYDLDGSRVEVTTIASAPAGVVSATWRATGGTIDIDLALTSVHAPSGADASASASTELTFRLPDDVAPTHEDVPVPVRRDGDASRALHGVASLHVETDGSATRRAGGVHVSDATWVHAVLATGTTSRWPEPGPLRSPQECRATTTARALAAVAADTSRHGSHLLAEHVDAHRALFDRVDLRIGRCPDVVDLPAALAPGATDDGTLASLMFAYGRYLLMASSRPGSPPANLQGIWNQDARPAWSSNYTINVNTQMNYWAAEVVGLPECHEPLLDQVGVVARHGTEAARTLYGCDGWVAHHNTDVWGWALPVGGGQGAASWADWWMGGVWLSRHLWDHYDFTGDDEFLRSTAWPLLRGAAAFCLDWLVERADGSLMTLPSTSPEATYLRAADVQALTSSSAMDLSLVGDLFDTCARAARVLGLDDPVVEAAASARARLDGLRVGSHGQVCEWAGDPQETDQHHRHLSPLVGLHPLDLIDTEQTPELAAAARRTLNRRGPGSTGWSLAWKLSMRARLGDAEHAGRLLAQAVVPTSEAPAHPWAGGLHPNLFATHPPFQIDGNFGLMGGIAEMLVQSHGGRIRLLPALPSSWPDGELWGLRARGGVSVDLRWAEGRLRSATLHATRAFTAPVTYGAAVRTVDLRPGDALVLYPW